MTRPSPNGFDRLAQPYRWMEYLSFGRALERCRFRCLPYLTGVTNALLLGDGDGRFAARLLQVAPGACVHAVDGSAAMLKALLLRCGSVAAADRVRTHHADLSRDLPESLAGETFDLVTTHFFFDCLTTAEIEQLVVRVKPKLRAGARWVVSEFAVPHGMMWLPSALIVRGLYLSFRLLTGLRVQRLPDYRDALIANGFALESRVASLGGLLVSELWQSRS